LPSVERVVHAFPQLHVTVMFLYSGWIFAFMGYLCARLECR
jgi:hypothetical protein